MIDIIFFKITKILLRLDNLLHRCITKSSIISYGKHPKHDITNYHQFFIDYIKEGSEVLDIGCGNGLLSIDISKNKNAKVVGVDINKKQIKEAISKATNKNAYGLCDCTFIQGDATYIFKEFKKQYDYIVLSNVLEHIDKRIDFLKDIKRIGKIFLIRVPLINRDWKVILKKNMGVEYRLDKTHFIEYKTESFKQELSEAGYNIISIEKRFGELYAMVKVN